MKRRSDEEISAPLYEYDAAIRAQYGFFVGRQSQRLCIQLVALGHKVGIVAAHLVQQVHGQLFHIQNIILDGADEGQIRSNGLGIKLFPEHAGHIQQVKLFGADPLLGLEFNLVLIKVDLPTLGMPHSITCVLAPPMPRFWRRSSRPESSFSIAAFTAFAPPFCLALMATQPASAARKYLIHSSVTAGSARSALFST